jgi:hypothetical protein
MTAKCCVYLLQLRAIRLFFEVADALKDGANY